MSSKERQDYGRHNTICVFSQPRSGTTWFTNLLLSIPCSLKIDEPLFRGFFDPEEMPHSGIGKIKELDHLNFYYHQPIPEDADFPEATRFFDNLFKLKYINPYLLEENSYLRMFHPNTFIFKFNEGNLLVNWLIKNFNFTPVVLHRNPYAVISSQLSFYAFEKVAVADGYKIPEFRFSEYFQPFHHILRSLKHPEEKLAARWCMNYIPVSEASDKWLTVYYERLVDNPEAELEKVFSYLGFEQAKDLHQKIHLPAFRKYHNKSYYQMRKSKDAWKSHLTKVQTDRISRVLNDFGIKGYNQEEFE